jgi:hypothetical protein
MVRNRSKKQKDIIREDKKRFPTLEKHRDNIQLLFSEPKFIEKVKVIRKNLGIPTDGFTSEMCKADGLLYKWHDSFAAKTNDINYFTESINELISQFHVPENYHMSIRQFILTAKTKFLIGHPYTEILSTPGFEFATNKQGVLVRFHSHLTDKDLLGVKKLVNETLEAKGLSSIKPLKDVDTKIRIEEYHKNRAVRRGAGDG